MDVITYQKSYREYKAELDNELAKTAEGFVRIGYLLKVARDTNVLAESGYKTVAEFAQAEYSLDKTQVSRFISINDKFSEDGYSDRLRTSYQGFGYAKLTLMLQLPDAVNEVLTPAYSKSEIQSIKDEIDEEKKVSDIEVCLEAAGQPETPSVLPELDFVGQVIYKLGHDNPGLFTELHNDALGCSVNMQHFQRIMAPAGEKTYSVRIPGTGRIMLMLNDSGECRAVNSRTGEFEDVTWQQLRDAWETLSDFKHCTGKNAAERWSELYREPYPNAEAASEKAEVAPEQPKTEKKEVRKESKVSRAKIDKPKPAAEPEEKPQPIEQIPGQTDIENDFPELMPEPAQKEEDESPQTRINTECEATSDSVNDNNIKEDTKNAPEKPANPHKYRMRQLLGELDKIIESERWGTALIKVHDLKKMIEEAAGEGEHHE